MAKQHNPFILSNPPEDVLVAYGLLMEFLKINGLLSLAKPITIKLDYYLEDDPTICGEYFLYDDPWSIHINPKACIINSKQSFNDCNEVSYHGYPVDMSMFGVTIHEFAHLIVNNFYPTLFDDFKHEFPQKRLYLTRYTESDPSEELVELIRLYIQNPLFLKMIDIKSYKFIKSKFKSPTACSNKQAYRFYTEFPKEIRHRLEVDWGIMYDIEKERFVSNNNSRKDSK